MRRAIRFILCLSAFYPIFAVAEPVVQQAAWPGGQPLIARWAGHYLGGVDDTTGRFELKLRSDGGYRLWTTARHDGGLDAVVHDFSAGLAMADGDRLMLRERLRGGEKVIILHVIDTGQRRCLMSAAQLLELVNLINASGRGTLADLACDGVVDGRPGVPTVLDADWPLPHAYRALLMSTPFRAIVTAARERSSHPRAYWNGSASLMVQRERLDIDRGTTSGVFAGMRLYAGKARLTIDQVAANRASGVVEWEDARADGWVGAPFSSRAPQGRCEGSR